MEWILISIGIVLVILGIIGSILPILPGPPLSLVALLLLQFREEQAFTWKFIIIWAVITIVVTLLDFVIPSVGTKKYGGSKQGVWGCFIGLVAGLFFPPIGLIVGPFVGALVGEVLSGKDFHGALKPALGSFIGFLVGTVLKLIAASVMAYYFFTNL